MKKAIVMIVFVMLVVLTVYGQDYDNQYYDYGDEYNYDSPIANQEYYYDYENILPEIGRYETIYYWEHPYKYINFVIVGERVYIIPRDIFYRVYQRNRFFLVSMERFITLSCFGMPYYDNYYRFYLYSNYYRYNYYRGRRYGRFWFRGLRNHYRKYYRNRRYNSRYRNLRKRYVSKRGLRQNYRSNYGNRRYNTRYKNSGKKYVTKRRLSKSYRSKYRTSGNPRGYQRRSYKSRKVNRRSIGNSYSGKNRRTYRKFTTKSRQFGGNSVYRRKSKRSTGFGRVYSKRSGNRSQSRVVRRRSTQKRSIRKSGSSNRRSRSIKRRSK